MWRLKQAFRHENNLEIYRKVHSLAIVAASLFLPGLCLSADTRIMPLHSHLFTVRHPGDQEIRAVQGRLAGFEKNSPLPSLGWSWLRSGTMKTDAHTHYIADREHFAGLLCISALHLDCLSLPSAEAVRRLASRLAEQQSFKQGRLLYSCGLHPMDVQSDLRPGKDGLEQLLSLPEISVIGEIGLHRPSTVPFSDQESWFDFQLSVADNLQKPVLLHCVHAMTEVLAYRRKYPRIPAWMVHGFRGKPQQALQWTSLDFYLSFGPRFNTAAMQACPPQYLLLETDSEGPGRAQDLSAVYQQAAAVLSLPVERIECQVSDNLARFIGR